MPVSARAGGLDVVAIAGDLKAMNAPAKSSKLIRGSTGDWEVVVGMEVHAQVTSRSKLFSGASTEFGGEPNSHVSLVDAAMPGMLPVINEECIAQAIRTGLGLKAKINLSSVFDRKNYFYPDLPQGYQISQYKSPVVGEGEVIVDLLSGERVIVGIEYLIVSSAPGTERCATSRIRRSTRWVSGRSPSRYSSTVVGVVATARSSASGQVPTVPRIP